MMMVGNMKDKYTFQHLYGDSKHKICDVNQVIKFLSHSFKNYQNKERILNFIFSIISLFL